MDQIVEQKCQEHARNEALTQHQGELIAVAQQTFNNTIKISAGVSFKARHLVLSDGTVLQKVRDIKRQKEEKALASNKQQQAKADAKHKVEHARAKGVTPEHWNLDDLKAIVSWFKRPGDSKMPTTKAKLLERYALTMNRSEEERSRLKEGEDAIVEEGDNGVAGGVAVDE